MQKAETCSKTKIGNPLKHGLVGLWFPVISPATVISSKGRISALFDGINKHQS